MRPQELVDLELIHEDERVRPRIAALDGFRGLAILFMMVDHVTIVFGFPDELRWTFGRLAMPMFFVLGGFLCRRLSRRHLTVALWGLAIPLLVPWIDSPNVLLLFSIGAVLIVACRWAGLPVLLLAVLGLTLAANGWLGESGGYPLAALVGLMAIGTVAPLSWFLWADRVPGWVKAIGRAPVSWYVGHLLALQTLWLVLR